MKVIVLITIILYIDVISIYTFSFKTDNNVMLNLNEFRNKKILLVNIATRGSDVSQIAELEQFYKLHKDSVIVIGFPSNSFGNTTLSSTGVKEFLTSQGVTFPVVRLTDVIGENAHPIYKWLATVKKNGSLDVAIEGDFQKILISKKGKIKGVFSSVITPGSIHIANAMKVN
jgi:glutathione peroxidase